MNDTHREARHEARRLIKQLVALLQDGEHLGVPHRDGGQIVIPIEGHAPTSDADADSMRALLAAWLDRPPRAE